ncbi:MAG: acyl carrier protein [Deltaproteobacteria bacterium]|nr:MAG: acyl carrier protein [Deltaproteobacteria bacterium]
MEIILPTTTAPRPSLWLQVQAKVATLLHVPVAQVAADKTFKQLGLDSLDLVELQLDLESELQLDLIEGSLRDVDVMQLTLAALVEHLDADCARAAKRNT